MKTCSFGIYMFVLLFAPLAFGTSEFWSMTVVQIATACAGLILFGYIWFFRKNMVQPPGVLPLLLLTGYMAFQLIPLPPGIVKVIAPGTYDAYFPAIGSPETWIPLTVYQKATLQELFRIACYGLFYFMTVQLLCDHRRLKNVACTVIFLAAAIAILAIIQRVGSPDKIYWLKSVPEKAHPFGPWVNPNQYAGFMEMLIPLAFAVFLFYKPRLGRDESLRQRIIALFTLPGANMHLLMGLAAVTMSLSVFVSLCRGGILTLLVSIFIFFILHQQKKARNGKLGILIIIGCVVVSVSWFGWSTVLADFARTIKSDGQIYDGRLDIWADSYRLLVAFLPFGSGFGTFIDVFPSFQSFASNLIFDHAHNDYIELLTDGGLVGFALAAWFVLAVIKHGWKMIRTRRDLYAVLVGIGALTGILAVLMHSVTDFNMHNGAVGLYFFFLCGFMVASVNIRVKFHGGSSHLRKLPVSVNRLTLLAVVVFTAAVTIVQLRTLEAGRKILLVNPYLFQDELKTDERKIVRDHILAARKLDPLEAYYSHELGVLAWQDGDSRTAAEYYREAIRKNPMAGSSLQWFGLLTHSEESEWFIEEGYKRALNRDELALRYVEHLFWKDQREKALATIAERLTLTPTLLKDWEPLFRKYALNTAEIAALLGDSVTAWIGYGIFLEGQGNVEDAEFYRSTALNFIENQPEVKPEWYSQLINYYRRTKNDDLAKATLHQAIKVMPQYAQFRIELGDYYQKEGVSYRAREEYEAALVLDPGSRGAKQRLRKMGLLDSY